VLFETEHRMPNKILHVVGRMDRGGVETWLMHTLRKIDRREFEFHFLVQTTQESAYDAEIGALGGKIHCAGNPKNPVGFALRFNDVVRRHGPFRAVHSHVYFYSGFVLKLASEQGIPIRIAHSHTARRRQSGQITRLVYEKLMRHWLRRYATHRIGASRQAGEALFGLPFTLISYGIDFARFNASNVQSDGDELKRRYRIAAVRKVIGHIGRFVPEKNHTFLVHTFHELVKSGTDAHLLLVGAGPLLPEIQQLITSLGLSDRCCFAGSQSDVVPFLRAMDLVLLPSQWEGLGIVGLEAQAAGVPLLASTGVPTDADVIPELVEHIPLDGGAEFWAAQIRRKLEERSVRRGDEPARLERSKFGIQLNLESLSRVYTQPSADLDLTSPEDKPTCDGWQATL
jgi:glycosyltransferase involved in cell wall biosynthesis